MDNTYFLKERVLKFYNLLDYSFILLQVQLLYQSTKLDTNFQIILVRLEIFTGSMSKIDKNGGDIESYLESFCKWQSKENPEHWDKLSRHPDHWDHGLLLTGLNLYDVERKFSSVIGKNCKLKKLNSCFSLKK
jgi:hypothetical protein